MISLWMSVVFNLGTAPKMGRMYETDLFSLIVVLVSVHTKKPSGVLLQKPARDIKFTKKNPNSYPKTFHFLFHHKKTSKRYRTLPSACFIKKTLHF